MLTEALTVCAVCDDDRTIPVGTKQEKSLVRCFSCGTMRVERLDPQAYTARYMTGWYQTEHIDSSVEKTNAARYEHDSQIAYLRITDINEWKSGGTLLDVGCSNGAFVNAAVQAGFDAYGIDLCPDAFVIGLQDRLKVADLGDTGFHRRQLDVITFNDVFEHLLDPKKALRQANGLLKRDGLLVLEVPDFGTPLDEESLDYHHVKPIEHIFYPSPETVERMLKDCDFVIHEMTRPIPNKVVFYAMPNPETVLDVRVWGPTGLGDMHWLLLKLGALKESEAPCRLRLTIPGYGNPALIFRAAGFLKLLPMLDAYDTEIAEPVIIDEGAQDVSEPNYRILANGHIERGHRIEEWYPHLKADFHYEVTIPEKDLKWAGKLIEQCGRKAVIIYASNEAWNYNISAGKAWTEKDWSDLVNELNRRDIYPILIGKAWDREFALKIKTGTLVDLIGKTTEGQMLALFKKCHAVVGLCSGATILSVHVGAPSMVFWPLRGNIGANMEFHKDFQTDWVDPIAIENETYVPMSLGGFTLEDVLARLEKWGAL